MRTAACIAPSATDAEEAVQDAFVKAYGALETACAPASRSPVAADDRGQRGAQPPSIGWAPRAARSSCGRRRARRGALSRGRGGLRGGALGAPRGARPAGPRRPRGHRLPLRPRPLRGGDRPGARRAPWDGEVPALTCARPPAHADGSSRRGAGGARPCRRPPSGLARRALDRAALAACRASGCPEPHTRLPSSTLAATLRLAGDTLLWEAGGLLLRLEGAASKAAALLIARSLGPPANRGG